MTQPALEVKNLRVSFGGLRAVDNVSFVAQRRQITTVIGPNGAGKSTLFNLISGAIPARSGSVLLDGINIAGQPPERTKAAGLARSFQITNLFFEMTVFENLQLAAQVLEPVARSFLPVSWNQRSSVRAESMLERFGLSAKAGEPVANLSHGEQRRLEIAICLVSQPKVLLLDEPTQGMSHADTEDTAALIRSLADDVTILLVEHDIGLVMSLSDHVVVMHQGRKIAEGRPSDIRSDPAVQSAYLGHA